MSNEESGFGGGRRTPRQGVGGSPVGSWLTVVLAVVAVVIGFLILRDVLDDGTATDGAATGSGQTVDTTGDSVLDVGDVSIPAEATTTTSTTIARVTEGASVIVANANSVGGSAGDMTAVLGDAGYATVDPVNASGANRADSVVYYDEAIAGADQVAQSVARDLGGLPVEVVETPAPTVSGDLGDAGVLVLLGDNEAGRTIEDLSASAAPPAPAGETTATGTAAADG